MSLIQLFGGPIQPLPEDTYFARWQRIKPQIESSPTIVNSIDEVFSHVYNKTGTRALLLGHGDSHEVYHVGEVVDPRNGTNICVAVRLYYCSFDDLGYSLENGGVLLASHLEKFEGAFAADENPPYFAGLASWINPTNGKQIIGFVLEDASEKKKYSFRKYEYDHQYEVRSDGKKFFLDPYADSASIEDVAQFLSNIPILKIN